MLDATIALDRSTLDAYPNCPGNFITPQCPLCAPLVQGGACNPSDIPAPYCLLAWECRACGNNLWTMSMPLCACSSGTLSCNHVDCFGPGRDTFIDPACTRTGRERDDAVDAVSPDSCGSDGQCLTGDAAD
jgi:hypothetical protein